MMKVLNTFEIGKLYYRLCAFDQAVNLLGVGLSSAQSEGKWDEFGRILALLLRIWAERLEFGKIDEWSLRLSNGDLPIQDVPSIHYALGISSCYKRNPHEGLNRFSRSFDLSTSAYDRNFALFGMASSYSMLGDWDQVERYLGLLEDGQREKGSTNLKVASLILRAVKFRANGQYQEALLNLADSQKLCQTESHLYMALNTLFGLGMTYLEMKDFVKAEEYFDLLHKLVNPAQLKHLSLQVDGKRELIKASVTSLRTIELMDGQERVVVMPDGQRVDLKKQFVLLNLLKVLGESKGQSLTKEEIVGKLWKEEYHPLRHDNKIHATILRLRRLLEEDAKVPQIIQNVEDGYRINPQIKFIINGGVTQ